MLATGKQIWIKDRKVEVTREIVPVLRNGKPTKRTKEVTITKYSDALADSYMVDGHEVYMIREDVEKAKKENHYPCVTLFKEDSSAIFADCQFGRTGTAIHMVVVNYNVVSNKVGVYSNGYDGATGKGHGCCIKRINW